MVKVYGIIKCDGFAIGSVEKKIFIGAYSKSNACKIMMDETFIDRWNDNHIANISKLVFEMENE